MVADKPCLEVFGHCDHWKVAGLFERANEMEPATVVVTPWAELRIVEDFGVLPGIDAQQLKEREEGGRVYEAACSCEIAAGAARAARRAATVSMSVGHNRGLAVWCEFPLPERAQGSIQLEARVISGVLHDRLDMFGSVIRVPLQSNASVALKPN